MKHKKIEPEVNYVWTPRAKAIGKVLETILWVASIYFIYTWVAVNFIQY